MAVWIDHSSAIIAVFLGEAQPANASILANLHYDGLVDGWLLRRLVAYRHIHWQQLCEQVAQHLGPNDDILIVGPGQAKHKLRCEIEGHGGMKGRVLAIETEPRVSDEHLVAIADAFHRSDAARSKIGACRERQQEHALP